MKESRVRLNRKDRVTSDADNLELLISHSSQGRSHSGVSGRVKWYAALLTFGLAGSAACLWAMFYTSHGEQIAHDLGMTKVANSLENILELLALPVLMFTVILSVYALQRLYKMYLLANDPSLGRKRNS